MAWRRIALGKRSETVGDAYRNLADLLLGNKKALSGYRVPNGTIMAITNGLTLAYGQQPQDLDAGVGQPIAAGAGIGLNSDLEAAWDLAEIWVRNTTPASNAVVVVNGPLFAGQDE